MRTIITFGHIHVYPVRRLAAAGCRFFKNQKSLIFAKILLCASGERLSRKYNPYIIFCCHAHGSLFLQRRRHEFTSLPIQVCTIAKLTKPSHNSYPSLTTPVYSVISHRKPEVSQCRAHDTKVLCMHPIAPEFACITRPLFPGVTLGTRLIYFAVDVLYSLLPEYVLPPSAPG